MDNTETLRLLRQMRTNQVEVRREAASKRDMVALRQAQADIEAIDYAINDEIRVPQDKDWFLAKIVSIANSGVGIDIVLSVSGQTITGVTISTEMYFEEMAHRCDISLISGPPQSREILESLSKFYRSFKNIGKPPEDASEDFTVPLPGYIHLQNAKVIGEDKDTPNTGSLLWRGRLSAIDGFAVGTMERS